MNLKPDPSSKRARIAAAVAILAITAAGALALGTNTAQAPNAPEKPKTEATDTPPQAGEAPKAEKPAGETPKPAPKPPTKPKPAPQAPEPPPRDFETQTAAKAHLAGILATERDFKILEAIIQCESGWEHYWTEADRRRGKIPGAVKVASGNIGYGQINQVHLKRTRALGLDVYRQKDNLAFTAQLYREQGINPWKPYSGHCFIPKLTAQGIEL